MLSSSSSSSSTTTTTTTTTSLTTTFLAIFLVEIITVILIVEDQGMREPVFKEQRCETVIGKSSLRTGRAEAMRGNIVLTESFKDERDGAAPQCPC